MKFRLLSLIAGIAMITLFVQCKDSLTQGARSDFDSKIAKSTLIAPENGSINKPFPVTFKWQQVDDARKYRFQMAWNKTFPDPTVNKVVTDTNYEVTDISGHIDPDETYYWRVQVEGDGDSDNWSPIHSFSTKRQEAAGDDVATDRAALMELYGATGGDSWDNNSGWGSDKPLKVWHGIETNSEGRVTRVDLWHNNLEGKLPASIGQLDKVTYFNVKYNHLTGSIPSTIGNMSSLEVLILQGRTYDRGNDEKRWKEPYPSAHGEWDRGAHQGKYYSNTNEFSGQIPAGIGNLSNLIAFELSNAAQITGPIPPELGNLSNLKGLYLSGANFTGYTIPDSFGQLTNLKNLYIEGAGLVGELPSSFQNLTKLTHINLGGFDDTAAIPGNSLTGDIPDFSQFTDLRGLILGENDFTGQFPQYFNNGNFTDLNVLNLSWNRLTGTLPRFDNLPDLYFFGASGNRLTGSINSLTDLPKKIRIITVGWNNFDGEFPQHGWPDYYQLKTIMIGANPISGDIPCSFWQTIDNPELNHVRFGEMPNIGDACLEGAEAMQGDGSLDDITLP